MRPAWQRPAGRDATVTRPPAEQPPEDLRIVRSDDSSGRGAARRASGTSELERQAALAGRQTASAALQSAGRFEAYRAGVWRGMHVALGDARLGHFDRLEGSRLGSLDPQARGLGSDDGSRAAEDLAREAAEEQVATQFSVLDREPRFDPRPGARAYRGPQGWALAAELREVFLEVPFADSRLEGWRLYRGDDPIAAFDRGWAIADRAFEDWRSDRRLSRFYRTLATDAERARFRAEFLQAFDREIDDRFPAISDRAWRAGFDDGWDYGAHVMREWSFRRGYAAGFDSAAAAAAEGAFRVAYPGAFERRYRESFAAWSEALYPEILDVRLIDADDDGIFEPSEGLEIEVELANLGGGSGDVRLEASGPALPPQSTAVRFDGRGRLERPIVFTPAVRPDARLETSSAIELSLGRARRDVELRVSRPIGFAGPALTSARTLEGRARIELAVLNRSRKPQRAQVALDAVGGASRDAWLDLGTLDPGARAAAAFDLDSLHPLDLIDGSLDVQLSVRRGDEALERRVERLPDQTADPSARDLARYLLLLARNTAPSAQDVARAQALLLRQLAVEWRSVADGPGNPYRDDLRGRGARTLLGELAAAWAAEGPKLASPHVLSQLGADLEAEVERLPGFHPRLRKAARELSQRIG